VLLVVSSLVVLVDAEVGSSDVLAEVEDDVLVVEEVKVDVVVLLVSFKRE